MTEYTTPVASGLAKDSVYELAESIGKRLGFAPGGSLEDLVSKLGGRIRYQNLWDIDSSESGSIQIHTERNFDIFLATHTGPLRDRFTIAHELGHYFLHFLYPLKMGTGQGPMAARRYGSGRVEWEANWFAAGLLMPSAAFRSIYQECDRDIIATAERFGVSVSAAQIRVQALGLS